MSNAYKRTSKYIHINGTSSLYERDFFNVKKLFLLKTIQLQFVFFFAIFSSKSSIQIVFFSQYYWKITESNSEEICEWNENMGTKTEWKVYGKYKKIYLVTFTKYVQKKYMFERTPLVVCSKTIFYMFTKCVLYF